MNKIDKKVLKTVKVTRDNFFNSDLEKKFYNCYREVFSQDGEEEWSEYKICKVCDKHFGFQTLHGSKDFLSVDHGLEEKCPACGSVLSLYHSDESIKKKIEDIFNTSIYSFFLLKEKQDVVGFIIGYTDSFRNVWKTSLRKIFGEKPNELIYKRLNEKVCYIDEIGILRKKRLGVIPILLLFSKFFRDQQVSLLRSRFKSVIFWTAKHSKIYDFTNQFKRNIIYKDPNSQKIIIDIKLFRILIKLWIAKIIYL